MLAGDREQPGLIVESDIAHLDAHVPDERHDASRDIDRREIAVDVVDVHPRAEPSAERRVGFEFPIRLGGRGVTTGEDESDRRDEERGRSDPGGTNQDRLGNGSCLDELAEIYHFARATVPDSHALNRIEVHG